MLKSKLKLLCLLFIVCLNGCTSQSQLNDSVESALQNELKKNQARFLHHPITDVVIAFQRQPTLTAVIDKQHNAVWEYDIYDHLTDPKTQKLISINPVLPFLSSKIHWKEFYHVNSDGIVYEIKIKPMK